MKYEVVIGLETHVELATESKIFCSCGGHAARKTPNDCVCPACCGMPGMLPVMNKRVVELAIMAGTLLNCKINRYITFANITPSCTRSCARTYFRSLSTAIIILSYIRFICCFHLF